jgi:hypothetical protein
MVARNILKTMQKRTKADEILILGLLLLVLWALMSIEWFYNHSIEQLLWFCDISLLLTGIALITRSRVIITAQFVGCFAYHLLWNMDFLIYLVSGHFLLGATNYMFYSDTSIAQKCLSLIAHTAIVPCTLYGIFIIGTSRKAWLFQWLQTLIIFCLTIIFTQPEQNINWMFGTRFGGITPSKTGSFIYYALMTLIPPFLLYLPLNYIIVRVEHLYKIKLFQSKTRLAEKNVTLPTCSFLTGRLSPATTIFFIFIFIITTVLAIRIVDYNFSLNNILRDPENGMGFSLESLLNSPKNTSIHSIHFNKNGNNLDIALKLLPDPELLRFWSNHKSNYEIQTQKLLSSSAVKLEEIPSVPQQVTLNGIRNHKGSIVWGVVFSNDIYFQKLCDLHSRRNIFHAPCTIGDQNPFEQIEPNAILFHSSNPIKQNCVNEISDIYILCVVEVLERKIVSRSSLYIVKRTRNNIKIRYNPVAVLSPQKY